MKMSRIPITRHIKLRKGVKVYTCDRETLGYWQRREYKNALNQIYSTHSEYSLEQMRDAVRSDRSCLPPTAEGESCMR